MRTLFAAALVGLLSSSSLMASDLESGIGRKAVVYVQNKLGFTLSTSSMGGATIRRIEASSPAERSGLKVKDTIIMIDGVDITSAEQAYEELSNKTDEVEIKVRDEAGNEFYSYMDIPLEEPTKPSKPKTPREPGMGTLRSYWKSDYGSELKLSFMDGSCESEDSERYNYQMTFSTGVKVSGLFTLNCDNFKMKVKPQWGNDFKGALSKDMKTITWFKVDFGRFGKRDIIWR